MYNKRQQLTFAISGLPVSAGRLIALVMTIVLIAPVTVVQAHTPYGQWDSYRIRHLQVLTSRSDLVGDAIADKWVAVLAEHLPKSKAVVSRARDFKRVASLLKTDQAKVAVLSYDQAQSMVNGSTPFEEFGPLALQVLVDNGEYLLVAREDLPTEHGFLVVDTLLGRSDGLQLTVPEVGPFGMQVHPGAQEVVADH